MNTIVTKAEYAALKQRQPSAISNWIAAGKISKDALVGEGVRARIWVEQADADLLRNLDPAQQAAQVAPVAASSALPIEQASGAPLTSPRAVAANDDEDIRRRRKADADRAEHDAEAARRKLAVDEGKWMDAGVAAREWGRELSGMIAGMETFLFTTLSREMAERYGLDFKVVSVQFRESFRKHRATAAEDAADRRRAAEGAMAEAAE